MMNINKSVIWDESSCPTNYTDSVKKMETYVEKIKNNLINNNIVMLVENYNVYTKGTSAIDTDYLQINDIPVIQTNRGGKYTYHGLGQRIIYPIIDLSEIRDIRMYVQNLEKWIIATLADLDIKAELREGLIGVWVKVGLRYAKIAAVGIRVSKWVAFHGMSVNVRPDLNNFNGIIPCGITTDGVTSLLNLGVDISLSDFDKILKHNFNKFFSFN